jgi:hypothetical protein
VRESGSRDSPRPLSVVYHRTSEQGLHSSRRIRDKLELRFVERHFEWVPYLYPDLDEDTSEADESAAIEAGDINSTGLRYVGTLALEERHLTRPPEQP